MLTEKFTSRTGATSVRVMVCRMVVRFSEVMLTLVSLAACVLVRVPASAVPALGVYSGMRSAFCGLA